MFTSDRLYDFFKKEKKPMIEIDPTEGNDIAKVEKDCSRK